jgi:hypothetical protein
LRGVDYLAAQGDSDAFTEIYLSLQEMEIRPGSRVLRFGHLAGSHAHHSFQGVFVMRTYLAFFSLSLLFLLAQPNIQAQDPGMQAAQQAQMATQLARQAAQQANDQMMQAAQQANQQAMQNAQQAASDFPTCYRCIAAKPKFSVKPGAYSAPVTLKMKDSTRGAVIYYTTDGWTPTAASTRYMGPITIDATTTLQAVAISPYGGRSLVATGVYTVNGVLPTAAAAHTSVAVSTAASNPSAGSSDNAKVLLPRGTAVSFVFASDVSSKTAEVGDKISLTLTEDLKVGDVVVVRKGAPAVATVIQVDKTGLAGMPGEVAFQVDALQAGNVVVRLNGGAAKEGQDKVGKAMGLMFVPVVPAGLFVHGKDAEIMQGAAFTAFVDADTLLAPAN